jgi:hypothetical protein
VDPGCFSRIPDPKTKKTRGEICLHFNVEIRDPEKTYHRSQLRIQGSKKHQIPADPQHGIFRLRKIDLFPE